MRRNALACGLLASVALTSTAWANADQTKNSADPNNWAMQSGNYNGQRYSKLDQINTKNVNTLKVAWQFSTGVLRGHEGSPIVVGNRMYLHTAFPNNIYALDLDNEQQILWSYKPKQDPSVIPVMCCDTVNRGGTVLVGDTVLFGQADTSLVALDAATGKEKWKVVNGDPKRGETYTGSLLAIKDKIIMGISGAEFGVRCHVTAYALADGKKLWRAYSMGPDEDILFDPEKTMSLGKPVGKDSSLKTWTGDQWKVGGGSVWGYNAYDAELNLYYYGSGNPSTWNPVQRAGPDGKQIDQKWSMTMFARNPDTGVAAWAYQMTPFDEWDYDGINEMVLVDGADVGGKKRNVLVHFDRNGFAYTMDRASGELLVAKPYDDDLNWSTGVEMDKSKPNYGRPYVVAEKSTFLNGTDVNSTNICPAALGFKDQQPVAYSPLTDMFYIPVNNVCMDYEPQKVSYTPGQPYVGAVLSMFPPKGETNTGHFTAYDYKAGKIVWQIDEPFSVWSGVLTTAGGIACHGTLEGYFKCRDQKDGKELFKHRLPSGSIGNVFTYTHKGKQYIGLFSGVGGWAGIGLAAGLEKPTDGLGAVGNYAGLSSFTTLGGTLTMYALP